MVILPSSNLAPAPGVEHHLRDTRTFHPTTSFRSNPPKVAAYVLLSSSLTSLNILRFSTIGSHEGAECAGTAIRVKIEFMATHHTGIDDARRRSSIRTTE
ncbi:hypothetical protein KM043_015598 [Ampulex compressa]|nr:hypothetical protein KM043_015598 [Ampulex compressa]